ncbi:MAG: ECF transporter S component [Clostridia bacterium]|nr:ECF transporter S component [Clostridia bacterium]
MSEPIKKKKSAAMRVCMTAVFAAIACVCTFIAVPLPIGYFNLGDIFVILAAYFIGPIYGAVAAGVGTALADFLMGYVTYVPATLIIKALMALVAYGVYRAIKFAIKSRKLDFIPRLVAALAAETVMVGGYFLFEALILGFGMGAAASLVGNAIQAAAGILGSTLISSAVYSSKLYEENFK